MAEASKEPTFFLEDTAAAGLASSIAIAPIIIAPVIAKSLAIN